MFSKDFIYAREREKREEGERERSLNKRVFITQVKTVWQGIKREREREEQCLIATCAAKMAWNPPPRQQPQAAADPWATTAFPTSPNSWQATETSTYPSTTTSQWPSTTTTRPPQTQQSSGYSTSAYPSSSSAAWGGANTSAVSSGWPSTANTSAAWDQQPSTASAWPTTSPTNAGAANASPWTSQASAWSSAPQPAAASAWPTNTSAPQWPETSWSQPASASSAWGGNTSALNQSTTSNYANRSAFGYAADPFSASTLNTSQQQPTLNASYNSAGSFNPFDVTNDDAGFFASAPKPAQQQLQQQKSQPKNDIPPPSATTQRLLRVASMLFERGSLIKADKLFIQEMVLRGDKKAEKALEQAERDGRLEDVHAAILAQRKKEARGGQDDSDEEDEDEDERAEAAAKSFKKRPSVARKNSDDDDEQTETLTDFRRQSSTPRAGGFEAPHPAAGGYTGAVPPEMSIQKGQFVGTILMRISSKKMFRKWKPVFFALDLPRLVIFENRREWEMGAAPKFVLPLHECMWIAKPTLKKTYSLIDDGRRVYYSTLKENAPAIVAQATMAGMERPTNFSPALDSRVVAKFGSHYPDEISAFAHAIYSVVLSHQKDVKANLASGGGSSRRQDSFRGGRAY